ncbi:MAG: TRAP transporter large permease [Lachnospiraceae bacterium]|nr:TRAP transporter large permease [Lachnospiraceae bacterium]
MNAGIMFLIFIVLIAFGMPIAYALGVSAMAYVWANGLSLTMIAQKMTTSLESFIYVALPLFILAGDIMTTGSITRKLVGIAKAIVGSFKGGLAYVNVVVSMLFGGIQGMAAADTVAIGSLLIPAMKEEGYDPGFSTAVTVASSCIGAVIPPSFLFIIFGSITGTSIGSIFMAGLIPGILLGLLQICYVYYLGHSKKHKNKIPEGEKLTWKDRGKLLLKGLPTLGLPVIILGGICFGIVTTTESAVLAVVYATIYCFITRDITVKEYAKLLIRDAETIGSCMIILSTCSLFGYILTSERIPDAIIKLLLSISNNKYILIIIITLFLLFIGTFMDATPAIMIMGPILLPVLTDLGLNPVTVGVFVSFAMVIGCITPPVGSCLYLAAPISGLSIKEISKATIPFIGIAAFEIILVGMIPWLTTFVPRALGMIK